MGKRRQQAKRERGKRRRLELMELATRHDFGVHTYSKTHMRIFGNTVIDYWPTSGKCWRTGTQEKSAVLEPHQAIEIALSGDAMAGADAHMASIAEEA